MTEMLGDVVNVAAPIFNQLGEPQGSAVVQFSLKEEMEEMEQMDSAHQDQHASASTTAAKAVAVAQVVRLTFVPTVLQIS